MLDTILQEYTVESVSERTKISRRNLERLKNADFKALTKPQAFGFVAIIEREFGVSLDQLRDEMAAYYETHSTKPSEPIFVREEMRQTGNKGILKIWIVLLLSMVAAGGYYAFVFQSGQTDQPVSEVKTRPTVDEKPEATAQEEAAIEESRPADESASDVGDETSETALPAQQVQSEEKVEPVQKSAETDEPKPYVPLDPVLLEPSVKIWLGIIDLESKKRQAKTVSSSLEIDSHGRKLLLTGHGRFEISDSEGNIFKFNDAKKHYFLIENGVLSEIDADTFRRENGGRIW